MRLLLTLMAMAVLVVSIGCDKKAEEAAKPKATGDTAAGTAAVAAPSTGDSSASATTKTAGTQTVSLKLPGMT